MRGLGLKSMIRKVRYHSYRGDIGTKAPNIINQNFFSSKPLEKLATDITQINIKGEKLYMSPILDMFNGEILAYTTSKSPNLELVMKMVKQACNKFDLRDAIIHSDQGWHYQHKEYQMFLIRNGILQSMSRKGNCLDNAMMENFFGIMKSELLYREKFSSVEDFEKRLKKYIFYYNEQRIKTRIKFPPKRYRILFNNINNNV